MYYEKLSDTLEKYYVEGYVDKNRIFDDEELAIKDHESLYFIVYLDSSNGIFSVEPYNGEIFELGE